MFKDESKFFLHTNLIKIKGESRDELRASVSCGLITFLL